ncbi:hypothetical protein [Amphiplicatus metriothermophilus]|uniref:Dolichyl-phosphate-mannose-protein mannosyltransferase n=1 Tax=Amphiplicatus metriothermophilus TaxID=1519374 RepID=A0A239PJ40_9PROT|nr:hypothetical protein [Amphiplicatus metriothermophilus]MBB5517855.1 hypothetical protein [Amphiplicatus metriothermophilus]SNT67811.1 hypothetical protein SAMN06297382_0304 [Amphiplicatus metriothermophilus]
MSRAGEESQNEAFWRAPAPLARRLAAIPYSWLGPRATMTLALVAAAPFVAAPALAPALLSSAPLSETLAPVAAARALAAGEAESAHAPLYMLFLLAGDMFADAPGRVRLFAGAFAAALTALVIAWIAAARFPAVAAAGLTAILAGYVAAPEAGAGELGLAFFLVAAIAFLAAPACEDAPRARIEGVLGGLCLAASWMSAPAPALAGLAALSASPFLTGRAGAQRYVAGVATFALILGSAELIAPGIAAERAGALPAAVSTNISSRSDSATASSGAAVIAALVVFAAAVFGGRAHARGWAAAAAFILLAAVAARAAGADAAPAFLFGAAIAAFSTASPFYDGIFRVHDRASVATGALAACLVLAGTAAFVQIAAQRLIAQHEAAVLAPAETRVALGLVHSGAPRAERWIREGRFTASEAQQALPLAPADQAAMLLAAAEEARVYARYGLDVAILAGVDAACLLGLRRTCASDGAAATHEAAVALVPRLDLDPATAAAKVRSQAVLYTDFRLVEATPLWDVWVRRGATLPAEVAVGPSDSGGAQDSLQ